MTAQKRAQWHLYVTVLKGPGILGCKIRDVAELNFEMKKKMLKAEKN